MRTTGRGRQCLCWLLAPHSKSEIQQCLFVPLQDPKSPFYQLLSLDWGPYSHVPKLTDPGLRPEDETMARYKDLVEQMSHRDYKRRATWPGIIGHPFMKEAIETLTAIDPGKEEHKAYEDLKLNCSNTWVSSMQVITATCMSSLLLCSG